MKMYIRPITKESLVSYLVTEDLTESDEPHAIKLLYESIEKYMRCSHPKSSVDTYRKNPIVTIEDNFDNLLIAADNISRSSVYTHYTDETHVLRTHTTAHIPGILRDLARRNDWTDVVILLPGLAYRRDVTDKKHVGQVHMLEMWRVIRNRSNKSIDKDDLLEVVEGVAAVAAPCWRLRIIDSPHPYTKQGIEVNAVLGERDIEILECGLINDQILANAGLDPGLYSGWAMGMGLDRLVMTLKDIPDVRYLRTSNPEIAKQMKNLDKYKEVSNQPVIKRDMSYSVPGDYVEEDINEDIRVVLGDKSDILQSVEILSETMCADLAPTIRERLGIVDNQKNILVRITLRHLERTLLNKEANDIYDDIYSKVNHGTKGYA